MYVWGNWWGGIGRVQVKGLGHRQPFCTVSGVNLSVVCKVGARDADKLNMGFARCQLTNGIVMGFQAILLKCPVLKQANKTHNDTGLSLAYFPYLFIHVEFSLFLFGTVGVLSIGRLHQILGGPFGLNCSWGWIWRKWMTPRNLVPHSNFFSGNSQFSIVVCLDYLVTREISFRGMRKNNSLFPRHTTRQVEIGACLAITLSPPQSYRQIYE